MVSGRFQTVAEVERPHEKYKVIQGVRIEANHFHSGTLPVVDTGRDAA